jgi:hypothetical protein
MSRVTDWWSKKLWTEVPTVFVLLGMRVLTDGRLSVLPPMCHAIETRTELTHMKVSSYLILSISNTIDDMSNRS